VGMAIGSAMIAKDDRSIGAFRQVLRHTHRETRQLGLVPSIEAT
jgi:hypothetical protein